MKSKLLLFTLLLMGVSVGAQTPISVYISDDCNKNGTTTFCYTPSDGSSAVLGTAGRTSCGYVQLWEGGPKWATFNVGATITDYANLQVGADATSYYNNQDQAPYYNTANCGGLYAWDQPNTNWRKSSWSSSVTTGVADVATTLWGSNWKTPTRQQLDTLQNSSYGKTTWTWCDGSTTQYVPGCTLKGHKVSGVGEYADKCIFLPAAGYFVYGSRKVHEASNHGFYWSWSIVDSSNAYGLDFTSGTRRMYGNGRKFGFSVRAVLVKTNLTESETSSTQNKTLSLYADGCNEPNTFTCSSGQRLSVNATPMEHRHFVAWNDGNTDNPRLVTMNQNRTYTAYFEPNTYVIHLSISSNGGKVFGQTSGKYMDTISIEATPDYGYHFTQWSDGNTENPRKFILTQDTAFAAEFAIINSSSCGNDIDWKYSDGTLSISGYGAMYDYSSNTVPWLLFRDSITSLTISENITSIGDYAFYGCSGLTSITCEAMTPPACGSWCFYEISSAIPVYVPCDVIATYQNAYQWKSFTNIQCIGAEQGNVVTNVVVTPSENSANIVWPKDDAANTYTIVITKNSTTICTLTFNANGQLMNIAFAPSRDGESPARVAESINGSWSFTVTSLDPATTYAYAVTTKNAAQSVLNTYTGNFTTTGTTGIDAVNTGVDTPIKFLRDGQIFIQRGGNTYDLRGQVVK